MNTQPHTHYTASFSVDQSPQDVFDAINNVRGWWSEARKATLTNRAPTSTTTTRTFTAAR